MDASGSHPVQLGVITTMPRAVTERRLISQAAGGDGDEFLELIRPNDRALRGAPVACSGTFILMNDAVQDAYLPPIDPCPVPGRLMFEAAGTTNSSETDCHLTMPPR